MKTGNGAYFHGSPLPLPGRRVPLKGSRRSFEEDLSETVTGLGGAGSGAFNVG